MTVVVSCTGYFNCIIQSFQYKYTWTMCGDGRGWCSSNIYMWPCIWGTTTLHNVTLADRQTPRLYNGDSFLYSFSFLFRALLPVTYTHFLPDTSASFRLWIFVFIWVYFLSNRSTRHCQVPLFCYAHTTLCIFTGSGDGTPRICNSPTTRDILYGWNFVIVGFMLIFHVR